MFHSVPSTIKETMRTVCRVCIASNVRMHSIEDAKLLGIYKKLAAAELNSDKLPCMVCYICYARLRSCAKFSDMARYSARIYHDLIYEGVEYSSIDPKPQHSNLSMTAIQFLSVNDSHTPFIKEETVVKKELIEDTIQDATDSVKAEQVDIKIEKLENEEFLEFEDALVPSDTEREMMEFKQSNSTINSHLETRRQQFTCHKCNKTFSKKRYLLRHMETHKKKSFSCNVCGKTCTYKANLLSHMRIHTGEKPFSCDMCGKVFRFKGSLIPHLRYHTSYRPYACANCNKQFTEISTLRRHMIVHTKVKAFSCSRCHTTFTEAGSLRRHMQLHAGMSKDYVCEVCNKAYRNLYHLKRHMQSHSTERPYACDVCEKRYMDAYALKRHKKTHSS